MNNIEVQYLELLEHILKNGVKKSDRTGTGTISTFGNYLKHDMSLGFPLLTTKKMAWKSMVVELIWFLKGRTDLKYLLDNKCYIWVGDAYKRYTNTNISDIDFYQREKNFDSSGIEFNSGYPNFVHYSKEDFIDKIKNDEKFSEKWGDLGKIYGYQWKKFNGGFDQIENLINDLKHNPDSRRLMVNAWNPSELSEMILPPCHYGFQCYTTEMTFDERFKYFLKHNPNKTVEIKDGNFETVLDNYKVPKRKLSLLWNQRSIDTPLGLPFNISSYALLLIILAKEVNMLPHELIASLGDTHIYLDQVDGVQEQIKRQPLKLPTIKILNDKKYDRYHISDFELVNYKSHEKINFPLSN